MIEYTFRHLKGIGEVTERALWKRGIHTWSDFLDAAPSDLPALARAPRFKKLIADSLERLEDGDSAYFAKPWWTRLSWRMYADFRHNAAFLDIETTGLSPSSSIVTLVGIHDREGFHPFVHGQNLEDLREAIERYDLIVTYNGASFDLPFIEHHMGRMFAHTPHIDIMYPLRWAGYKGGLKAVERRLRVGRPSSLDGIGGFHAVRMWHMWASGGRRDALDTLIRYNAEDVYSLPKLSEIAYNELSDAAGSPAPRLERLPFPEPDLTYSEKVVRELQGF